MMRATGRILVLAMLLGALTGGIISDCGQSEPVAIGFIAGLSGKRADMGIAGRNAVILAIEERNAQGGIAAGEDPGLAGRAKRR